MNAKFYSFDIPTEKQWLESAKYYMEINNFSKDNRIVSKEVIFFLAESNIKDVKLSSEHQNFIWLNFNLAYSKLTYANAKEVLAAVKMFLDN